MPVNVSAVMWNGVPFECLLSERSRTTIYRVPQFFAVAGEGLSSVVFDAGNFRAGVTTSPEEYFSQNDLAGQFDIDPSYGAWVRECCNTGPGTPTTNLHVVFQVRQELNEWPATDGQCWKADLGRGEHLLFVDGGEHPVPPSDDKPHWRNAVLAAIRIELNVTGGFEKVADQVSFRTTDDRWLDLWRLSVSTPEVSTSSPLAAHDLRERARGIALLAQQLGSEVDSPGNSAPLRRLLEAVQLVPLTDDAYRRIWFLQLHDRCRKFLHRRGRSIKHEEAFERVNVYRNEIAHEGVDRIDLELMKQLQQNVHEVVRRDASNDAKQEPG